MKRQRVLLAVGSATMGFTVALGCSQLLALLIRHIAIDQPSLGDLALAWGIRWGWLVASLLTAGGLLCHAQHPRMLLVRIAWLLAAAAAAVLAISLLAGVVMGLLDKHGFSAHFQGLPNPSRQAAAEAMLNAVHWAGLPVAVAISIRAFLQRR